MAVVLPIQNKIDFAQPGKDEYGSPCCNGEDETERLQTMAVSHNENGFAENERHYPCPSQQEGKRVGRGNCKSSDTETPMDIDHREADPCENRKTDPDRDEISDATTATPPVGDYSNRANDDSNDKSANGRQISSDQESKGVSSSQRTEKNRSEISICSDKMNDSVVDENTEFIESLMAVDIASTSNAGFDDEVFIKPESSLPLDIVDTTTSVLENNHSHLPELPEEDTVLVPSPTSGVMEMDTENSSETEDISSTIQPTGTQKEIVSAIASPLKESPYGGLENLGNTCYMASAIQLLCGLDTFQAELKGRIPPRDNNIGDNCEETKDEESGTESKPSLRGPLLDVMERLARGETVRPDKLKGCIDSRTSLFLGYHQQDAHEFLTTLFDIIDEDYKPLPDKEEEEEEKEEGEEKESTTPTDAGGEDEDGDNDEDSSSEKEEILHFMDNCADVEEGDDKSISVVDNSQIEEGSVDYDHSNDEGDSDLQLQDSPFKRQKVIENNASIESVSEESVPTSSMPKSKSYSEFKFSDIESLLHGGDNLSATMEVSQVVKSTAKREEPKCKLAGGRMSTVGVELTRFVDEEEDVQHTDASLDRATPEQQIVEDEHCDDEEEETASSPVASDFTTKVRVCLTCEVCKFRRSHVETYLHLSLDISAGSDDDNPIDEFGPQPTSSIEDGLRKFFAPEKREIKCEKCFHTSALQTMEITQLPRNLLLHLKRFIVDVSPDYTSISYRKDQSSVSFEERIDIETSVDKSYHHADEEVGFRKFMALDCAHPESAAYEIRSVVNHIGSSASCGHYTADAKRRKKSMNERENETGDYVSDANEINEAAWDERQWTRFNDSYVTKITSTEAVKDASRTAYMIMYELVG